MKKILIIGLFLLYDSIKDTWAQQCQDPDNTDFCVEVGYNKNKQPPKNIPLNVTANLDIKVGTYIFWCYADFFFNLANSLLFSSLLRKCICNIENNFRCLSKIAGSEWSGWFCTFSFDSTCFLRLLEWLTSCPTQKRRQKHATRIPKCR